MDSKVKLGKWYWASEIEGRLFHQEDLPDTWQVKIIKDPMGYMRMMMKGVK